jgi:hypothetical protein
MTLPEFTAEKAIYKTRAHYRTVRGVGETGGVAAKPAVVLSLSTPHLTCG